MPTSTYDQTKRKKLLLITSSGGGGLIQTANAKEQEALAKDPNLIIIRKDVLKDWVWKPIGEFFINFWNKAQLKGNVSAQSICVSGQFLADYFLHPTIFFYALYTAFKEDVDYIIDTQPLGTSAILRALRIFNRKKRKNVRLEKVLVDLPTKKATHFFRPIKKLSKRSRRLIQLTSIPPLLEEGETEEQFWHANCRLPQAQINREEVVVRQAFLQFKGKSRPTGSMKLKVHYKNQEELGLMKQTYERGGIQANVKPHEVEFTVGSKDRLITILLGSQPANGATLSYVKAFAELAREFSETTIRLFAFCANHTEGKDTLFSKVAQAVSHLKDYPKNLSIVPFSFQNEEVIAPLFYRSDITCTRSGGQTAMELMCVSTGEIWIHSEAKRGENLLSGIPGWESASAVYLEKMEGAKIVTPEIFIPHARQVFQTNNEQDLPNRALESTA